MASVENNPQAGAGRPLPKKEADAFKSVVKHYEMKQYKKAIKQADNILRKFPNHGETLAMKGLTLNYMSKRDEAHELVKLGLRNDMRSHVCWHVYGLLHRSDHNYNEAIKAYKQALRIDADNLQILRDLSMLQIQMRDLSGFAVTRNSLLTLKPNAKINWMAFALARHLSGDLRGAIKVIDTYMGTLTEGSSELGRCFESSELALYKNAILAEIPDNFKEALDQLNACEGIVVDRGALLMTRAKYQLKLKDFVAARQSVLQMFRRGMTENHTVHSIYMCALLELDGPICDEALNLSGTQTLVTLVPLSDEQKNRIKDAYENELAPFAELSKATARIPFNLLDDQHLCKVLDARCRKDLSKGVPSLCSELQSYLWAEKNGRFIRSEDPVDVRVMDRFKMIVNMVDGYVASLQSSSKFSPEDENEQAPSALLWAWYLRARLHELAGEYADGIAILEKCIEHTPDVVDIYELKASLLKASGDIDSAVGCLDKGRELDTQDRYINNQTAKYMLQAGKDDDALKCFALFARHEGNPEQNLYDMQCSWYELELAASLARKEDWGRSLKKYAAVVKHFDDFNEDQFDFHSYCLRKVTLRAYVSVLRFEDEVFGQDYYCQAAAGIIGVYLHLADNPATNETVEPDYTKMTAAERKKAKAIARKKKKAEEKKEADLLQKEAESNGKNQNQKGVKPAVADEDPLGKEFLKKDPLEEAKKYSAMLTRYAPKSLQSWTLQYDVAIRRKKALMAVQALFKARSIDPHNAELFSRTVDFWRKHDAFGELATATKNVLEELKPKILGNHSVEDFVNSGADRIRSDALVDLPYRCAVARALVETKTGSVSDAAALITSGGLEARQASIENCQAASATLREFGPDGTKAAEAWDKAVQQRFQRL